MEYKNKIYTVIGVLGLVVMILGYFFGIEYTGLTAYESSDVHIYHVYITICVLVGAAYLFFTEILPITVTAVLIPVILSTLGVITVKNAWISFGNTSIMTIVGLFMLGEATFVTGLAQRTAGWVINKAGNNEMKLLIISIAMIAFMSAFLNNSGITDITLPMLVSIAHKAKMSPSRIFLPTAYAASIGGTMTLVGTAPNMVTNALIG